MMSARMCRTSLSLTATVRDRSVFFCTCATSRVMRAMAPDVLAMVGGVSEDVAVEVREMAAVVVVVVV